MAGVAALFCQWCGGVGSGSQPVGVGAGSELSFSAKSNDNKLLLKTFSRSTLKKPSGCIPCEHIPRRSGSLFRTRELMHDFVESFTQEVTP